jgi:hypothetical protein
LAGKTSAALREDAFLVTINGVGALAGQGHNVSLDNLVKRRQEEAVRVFAYFLELILENEQRLVIRQAGSASSAPDASAGETNKSPAAPEPKVKKGGLKPDAFGSVADIAAMAAEQKEDALMPPPPPTDEQRLGFRSASRFRPVCPIRAGVFHGGCRRVVQDGDAEVSPRSRGSSASTPSTCRPSSSRSCARTPRCRAR